MSNTKPFIFDVFSPDLPYFEKFLIKNSSFTNVKIFIRNFSKYVKSGENTSNINGLVFDIASTHIDHFWRTMLEKNWKFDETTNLREFCFMVEVIAKDRFSIK